jgi:hypothetical protein
MTPRESVVNQIALNFAGPVTVGGNPEALGCTGVYSAAPPALPRWDEQGQFKSGNTPCAAEEAYTTREGAVDFRSFPMRPSRTSGRWRR